MATGITPDELYRRLAQQLPTIVIDVRYTNARTIPGAVHVPVTDLEDQEWDWDHAAELVVFCQVGRGGSDYAAEVLEEKGYPNVRKLVGGIEAWNQWLAAQGRPDGTDSP